MGSFARAVRMALRYRFTLLAAFVCSLLVGVFWGLNIGTLYPFVEIVFQGESMQRSISRRLEEAEKRSEQLEAEIEKLQQRAAQAPADKKTDLERQIELKEIRWKAELQAVESAKHLKPLVDKYLPHDPFVALAAVIGAMVVGTMLKSLCLVGSEVLVSRATHQTVHRIQNKFFRRTLRLDVSTFADDRTSLLLSCFTYRVKAVGGALKTLFGQAVREPLKMAVCLAGAAMISWRLLLLSLVMVPVGILLLRLLTRSIRRSAKHDMNLMTELYKRLSETFFGIVAVKSFTAEAHEGSRFRVATDRLLARRKRLALILAMAKPISEIMGVSIIAVAVLASSYLVLHRETHLFGIRISDQPLSPAALMVFYGLLVGVADPARKLSGIYTQLFLGMVASRSVFNLLDREPKIADPPEPKPIPRPHRELSFENVGFAYKGGERVLKRIRLTIPHGEKIALVGPNGCGKSTLAKLIPRLYDPSQGTVSLDGIDLREFRLQDLRQQIGLVTQETWLFDDTVFNNISYGTPEATQAEVMEAARKAHAHEFIVENLEQGYETIVGERGGRLSGGQRQRISLARAILRDPSIIILDEATSEIDVESEQLIHAVLEEYLQGRTAIMITHRLSTLELADRIVVMNRGQILDVGTGAELMRRCDAYRRLQLTQMGDAA